MSLHTQRTMKQLKDQCFQLGIFVDFTDKKENKTDYILALRKHYLSLMPEVPKTLELILQIESPMLCERFSVLSNAEQEMVWDSDDYIAEMKENGCRLLIVYYDGIFDFYSRNLSVETFLPISYRANIIIEGVNKERLPQSFIIDTEVISTNPNISTILGNKGVICESQLESVVALLSMNSKDSLRIQKDNNYPLSFRAFDILYKDGEWLVDKPLQDRLLYFKPTYEALVESGLQIRRPYSTASNKRAFYKALTSSGEEGIVLKNVKSKYITNNTRGRNRWIKVKRSMSETIKELGLADTIDCFVSGYEIADETKKNKGFIDTLKFTTYLQEEDGTTTPHEIAWISHFTDEMMEKITMKDEEGNLSLNPEFYGRVASLDGQCISGRNKRLKHAVLVDWRDDRSVDSCIMDKAFMLSMIL